MAKSARSILDQRLAALQEALGALPGGLVDVPLPRFLSDAAALRFHLAEDHRPPVVLALLGGTGTGKSTLTNRLLGMGVSATSFRRTFTAGPVAITPEQNPLPGTFLGVEHRVAGVGELPAKGEADVLTVVPLKIETVASATPASPDTLGKIATALPVIIDTPDLDGDVPQHHAQADRVFRWSQAVMFLVTPEKYQMTELVPYYRLAKRYALPCLFVMNKCEGGEMLEDYRKLLAQRDWGDARVYAIPRDDAAWEPGGEENIDALKGALATVSLPPEEERQRGIANRTADLADRLVDQIVAPLRRQRSEVDELIIALHAMETPVPGVDVSPITQQLQRRLQQRSVLYLIGPQRILDRARQMPGLLARLPRTTWDLFRGKPVEFPDPTGSGAEDGRGLPDFPAAVTEQFSLLQTKIDDLLRSNPAVERWLGEEGPESFKATLLDTGMGGAIAQQEIEDLNAWLEKRWNSNPRDTRLLMSLLRRLPGAKKLSQWSEAAPYLLTIVLAAHHAMFGHVDLMILGGYTLATWLTERLSNEVSQQARLTNRRIADRFAELAHEQIERVAAWLDERTPSPEVLSKLEELTEQLTEANGGGGGVR